MPAILTYALLSIPLIGAYAIFSLGISLIYRSSRVLNLAHGAMAMVPAYVVYSLVQAGVPALLALVLGVAAGAALGVAIERIFVRRLRPQGPTAQTVGTVAATGLLIALAAKIWGTTPKLAPGVFPDGVISLGRSGIRYGEIGLFVTAIVVSIVLFTFFARTQFGLAMRGAAQNRRAASLMGIDPDVAAAAAWALGGALAGLAGILLAAVTNLDPYTLSLQVLPAFVAALLGGLENLRGALVGSAVAGLSFGLVPYFSGTPVIGSVAGLSGSPQLLLTILALVVLATRGRRLSAAETSDVALAGSRSTGFRPASARQTARWLFVSGIGVVVWPLIVPFSVLGRSLLAMQNTLVAMSLVVMTGWVGQISLGQASFVGIAAMVTGLVVRGAGIGFPMNMLIAAAAASMAGIALGVVALRVRGLYLAVATLIFAWMTDSFLFKAPFMGASQGSSTIPGESIGQPGGFPTIDLSDRKTLFYVFAVVVGIVILAVANLRDTKTGRAFFAVRGSEMAAASLGIDVVRTKLVAFALSGALAGIAGSMLILDVRTVVPDQFVFTVSLQALAIAVVGGLGSLGGAAAAGVLFAALEEVFYRVDALSGWLEVVSALLLTLVLLLYPGGLAALGEPIRKAVDRVRHRIGGERAGRRVRDADAPQADRQVAKRVLERLVSQLGRACQRAWSRVSRSAWSSRSRSQERDHIDDWFALAKDQSDPRLVAGNQAEKPSTEPLPVPELAANPPALNGASAITLRPRATGPVRLGVDALRVEDVTVQFGGLIAVDDVSLTVREGSITGLIGPNGAGKTTCFNAILGLNDPSSGSVAIHGRDATALAPYQRARLGLARTFQVLQLFSELTVFDNLLVATHQHNPSGVWSNLAATPGTLHAESAARARVSEILHLLELDEYADRLARGLPFGVLRMVELGRALVTGARLVMLDEPASGLNEGETDRLSSVIMAMRGFGISVLLIEHDIRMVTGVCDQLYVLDRGRLIAEGTPAAIQRNPDVVAAYLGAPAGEAAEVL